MQQEEIIELYVLNQLPENKAKALESQMANDPELAAKVSRERLLQQAAHLEGKREFMQQLDEMHNRIVRQTPTRSTSLWKVAAAAALVIGISATLYLTLGGGPSPDELYTAYYEAPSWEASRSTTDAPAWQSLQTDYENGDYGKVEQDLLSIKSLISNPNVSGLSTDGTDQADSGTNLDSTAYRYEAHGNSNMLTPLGLAPTGRVPIPQHATPQIDLLLGHVYLQQDRAGDAITAFSNVAESESLLAQRGRWNLALAYLKQGNVAAAKTELEAVKNGSGKLSRQAAEVLKKL